MWLRSSAARVTIFTGSELFLQECVAYRSSAGAVLPLLRCRTRSQVTHDGRSRGERHARRGPLSKNLTGMHMDHDHALGDRGLHWGALVPSKLLSLLSAEPMLAVTHQLAGVVRACVPRRVPRSSTAAIHVSRMSTTWLRTHECECHKHRCDP